MAFDLIASVDRFAGFAQDYDVYRPAMPTAIIDALRRVARAPRPRRVVDLACGTGLSMLAWLGVAAELVGVEPSDDMRARAQRRFAEVPGVHCVAGSSVEIPLSDSCADIVTVSQALHWMEPGPTFAEVARVLRPGGVLAAIDYSCPPAFHREGEALYERFLRSVRGRVVAGRLERGLLKWSKDGHLERMRASGQFRHTYSLRFGAVERGDAVRLVGLALSHGSVQALLRHGATAEEIGLSDFRAYAERILGATPTSWMFTYRVQIAVK